MERRTTKTHPQFDLAAAKKTYAKLKEELCGEQITSPYDLHSVERLRDEHGLRQGMSFATDVFVFGKGPPPDRHLTKVSGLPYWPKAKAWPTADDGSPCQFLAQFCFLDSRDLVGELPGDLLCGSGQFTFHAQQRGTAGLWRWAVCAALASSSGAACLGRSRTGRPAGAHVVFGGRGYYPQVAPLELGEPVRAGVAGALLSSPEFAVISE